MSGGRYGWRSLKVRLVAASVLVELVMLTILVWNSVRLTEDYLVDQTAFRVHEILPLLNASISGPLLQEDLATLDEILGQVVHDAGLRYIAVSNAAGVLLARRGIPARDPHVESDLRTHIQQVGPLQPYALSMPIRLGERVIGGLDLEVDTRFIAAALTALRRQGWGIAAAEVILSILLLTLVGMVLTRQLSLLTDAAGRMASGNLAVRIPVKSRDEIGEAAAAFNSMAAQVEESQSRLLAQGERVTLLMDSTAEAIYGVDTSGICTFANPACVSLLGYDDASELLGENIHKLIHRTPGGDTCPGTECRFNRTRKDGVPAHTDDELFWRKDGTSFPAEYWSHPISHDDRVVGSVVTFFDITERKQAGQALRDSERRFRAIFDQTFQFIGLLQPDGMLLEINRTALDFGGLRRSELVGRPFWQARWWTLSEETQGRLRAAIAEAAAGKFVRYEVDILGAGSEVATIDFSLKPVRGEHGQVELLILEGRDITDRKRAEQTLRHQAYHDMLTALPNRWLLQDRLAQAMALARREGRRGALLFLDLDRFKRINDTLGHLVGDQLLLAVATRLGGLLRDGDTLARLGGDDFVLLLANLAGTDQAAETARRMLTKLEQPFTLPGREVHVTASVGIAVFPGDGADSETLLKHAEFAMYHAKDQGRGVYRFYTAGVHAQANERFVIEHELHRAIEQDELVLHYQPQVDLASGAIVGVEALVRWQHPQNGMIAPDKFVPVAEETGLIVPLGEWVLRRAIEDYCHWRRWGRAPQRLAVNLSARQLLQSETLRILEQVLAEADLAEGVLEFEITESGIMQDPERAVETVRAIKALGANIAIDDFGTGYSSLAYLKRFPVDALKIDRSFVHDIATDPGDAAIVETIIAMARTLNLTVVAEGIENRAQVDFLRAHGCDQAQGFFYARPMTSADLEEFLSVKARASSG